MAVGRRDVDSSRLDFVTIPGILGGQRTGTSHESRQAAAALRRKVHGYEQTAGKIGRETAGDLPQSR
jgi:hypothetical protein